MMLLGVFLQSAVAGIVTDDTARAPLQGVEVVVESARRRMITPASGVYLIDSLAPGIHVVLFRKVGYRPVRMRAILTAGDTLRRPIMLSLAPVGLPPIEVTASNEPPGMEAYAARKAAGHGHFIGSEVLRKSENRRVSEVLVTVNGVKPIYQRRSGRTVSFMVSSRGSGSLINSSCPMAIWYDGVKVFEPNAIRSPNSPAGSRDPPDINSYAIIGLEAIEVYRGAAETPAELSGTGASCGTIVLWSRRR